MAKIGIDARIWGVKHAGLGRYVENLVLNLQKLDTINEYVIFCRKEDCETIPVSKNWKKVVADIRHYSFSEQLQLVFIFNKEKLDLLHVPHYNVPIFYRGKFVVTIHDLLWHDLKSLKVTTLPAPIYASKYLGYKIVVANAIHHAEKIIVPSEAVKIDILSKYKLQPNKVAITYEGVSVLQENLQVNISCLELEKKYKIKKPYLLYVGSLYPHKNVESVVMAMKSLPNPPQLVIVSGRNIFLDKFQSFLKKEKAEHLVNLVGYVPDEELSVLYQNSKAFIFPTLSEGFGLPGLEAMQNGTPVVCSDLSVLREIYGAAALYFNAKDPSDINRKLKEILGNKELRIKLVTAGKKQAAKYSWEKMTKETILLYKQTLLS